MVRESIIGIFAVLFVFVCDVRAVSDYRIECVTPNNENARCESVYKCKTFTDALKGNPTQSQKDFIKESLCGYYDNVAIVCCGTKSDYKEPKPPKRTRRDTELKKNPLILEDDCSRRERDNGKIESPWVVKMVYNETVFLCDGTIINKRYIVTTIACVKMFRRDIFHGKFDVADLKAIICPAGKDCTEGGTVFSAEEIVLHKSFGKKDTKDPTDIALVRLNKDIAFNEYISPVCLPAPNEEVKAGEELFLTGWLRNNPTTFKVKVALVANNECQKFYSPVQITIDDGRICAAGYSPPRCIGISGSSLVRKTDSGTFVLEGIASIGLIKCADDVPIGFTNVPYAVQWIHDNVKN